MPPRYPPAASAPSEAAHGRCFLSRFQPAPDIETAENSARGYLPPPPLLPPTATNLLPRLLLPRLLKEDARATKAGKKPAEEGGTRDFDERERAMAPLLPPLSRVTRQAAVAVVPPPPLLPLRGCRRCCCC